MGELVESTLLLAAVVVWVVAIRAPAGWRPGLQVLVIGAVMGAASLAGSLLAEVLTMGALLGILGLAAATLHGMVRRSWERQRDAELVVAQRSALIAAMQGMADLDVEDAAGVAVQTLRDAGFDAAGSALVRDGMVVPIRLDQLLVRPAPVPVGEGLAGRAVTMNQTVTVDSYAEAAERLEGRPPLGTMICTPIRVNDRVAGVLVGAMIDPGPPTDAQIEVVEVTASHLGAVFQYRRQVANQRLLLDRMDRLDAMRAAFVDEVSDELRDPLTVVRGAGHTLRVHGGVLSPEARAGLIQRMCGQSDRLQRTVTALLDFSRFQAARRSTGTDVVVLRDVIEPFRGRIELKANVTQAVDDVLGADVRVDLELVRHAIAMAIDEHEPVITLSWTRGAVTLTCGRPTGGDRALTRSLIEQLVVESGAAVVSDQPLAIRLQRVGPEIEVPT